MGLSTDQSERLVTAAREARGNSYVPYSGFETGAAVLMESGAIHTGVLVENLVFGLAMCAERVALFSAIAQGGGKPVAMAFAAPDTAGKRTYPCGSCLQVAVELGGMQMEIVSVDPDGDEVEIKTIADIAPGIPHRKNPGAGKL